MALSLKTLESDIAAAERSVYAADTRAAVAGRALRDQWQAKVPTVIGGAGLFLLARQILRRRPRVKDKKERRDRIGNIAARDGGWVAMIKRYSPVVGAVPQVVTVISALIAAFAAKDAKKSLTSAAQVDLDRFAGTWYEIARLPKSGEKDCGTDSRITYARTDTGLHMLSLCRQADGSIRRVTGRAKLRDDASQSRFKITFAPAAFDLLPFVWSDYTIVDIADDYSTAIVGTENRKQLSLLAKKPVVDDSKRQDFLNKARAQGFDTTALVFTPHTATSSGEAASVKPSTPAAQSKELRPV